MPCHHFPLLSLALFLTRKARETGVIEDEDLETAEGLFSYVTEEEYGQIVQERQRDAWILSDGGRWSLEASKSIRVSVGTFCRWVIPRAWSGNI